MIATVKFEYDEHPRCLLVQLHHLHQKIVHLKYEPYIRLKLIECITASEKIGVVNQLKLKDFGYNNFFYHFIEIGLLHGDRRMKN